MRLHPLINFQRLRFGDSSMLEWAFTYLGGWIYRIKNPDSGSVPVQVTDGLPQIGFRTVLWAILLALGLAFGLHAGLKGLTIHFAFEQEVLDAFPDQVRKEGGPSQPQINSIRTLILESPLHADVPLLLIQNKPGEPDYTREAPPEKKPNKKKRTDFFSWLSPWIATYFSSDVSAVQIYLYFVSDCGKDAKCQEQLFVKSYEIVTTLKHNPFFILYRLQSGIIQLIATYVFSIGILVLMLREQRAAQIRKPLETTSAGEAYAKNCQKKYKWPESLTSLSFKETLKNFWERADLTNDSSKPDVDSQLKEFGAVYYEPRWASGHGTATHLRRANLLRTFHTYLADTLEWPAVDRGITAVERFRAVLPRTVLKVVASYAVNRRYSPESACERASETLDHAVDEIAAATAADRDLYSRLVELTPVVGFFGTVVGLSLAMLGANDVIRAQGDTWNYSIAGDVTYITHALQDPAEKQQFALQGMLSALSIKFDTTGWALILMFVLIVLGARVQRREYRTLSFVRSVVSESVLSVLPTIGGALWLSTGPVREPRASKGAEQPQAQGEPSEPAPLGGEVPKAQGEPLERDSAGTEQPQADHEIDGPQVVE